MQQSPFVLRAGTREEREKTPCLFSLSVSLKKSEREPKDDSTGSSSALLSRIC